MYKHLFGPVPSRRLGMSLGVDLVPHKICSLNCVYCECGRTTNLTVERKEYVPIDKVLAELEHYFKNNPAPDYITFSGAGEPTLNSRLGEVVKFIKENSKVSIALLTNATLLSNSKLITEISDIDLILPSLDAVSPKVFAKINRHNKTLKINEIINSLVKFKKHFKGKMWLEILILPNYNNSDAELVKLKEVIQKIEPDKIQLNTLDRPGAISDLKACSKEELEEIKEFWNLPDVEIIAKVVNRTEIKSYRKDVESAILETIARRPCTVKDLSDILGKHINEINKYLDVLDEKNKIKTVEQERGVFYSKK